MARARTTSPEPSDVAARTPRLRFPEFRACEPWPSSTVGAISPCVVAGGTPSTSEKSYWGGPIRWMNSGELSLKRVHEVEGRITEAGLRNSSTQLIPPRCTLIGLAGQGRTRGTAAMNFVELCTNQSIAAIHPNDSAFVPEFLYHNLDFRYKELRRLSANGEGRGGLNLQIIRSLNVPLPPLAEQRKIADCLTSLDEVIAAQGRKVEALKAHKKGLMQHLLPREGETVPRLRFPGFRSEPEWAASTLGDVADISSGATPLRANTAFYEGGTTPWVKTTDLNNSVITHTEECITAEAGARINPVGSILVAMYGGFKQIGRTGMLGMPAATNQAMSVLVVDPSHATPQYVLAWLNAKVDDWKRIAGSSRKDPNVTGSDVAAFPIRLPPTAEQQQIADCLGSLDAAIAAEAEAFIALTFHKNSLLQQLFPIPEAP